ncbi:hypothetical protein PISMIDRAFT_680952 [Pisolithus microcarpus 441]|uniref:Uncharacterized protein n=1 Tax=Pisolithus microcarpus 441 TaxID=765257 RepID=A0A0C9ZQ16_9AGAM|nr:hypothetical protein BKA83DRAFT_680952 [Pisolithus microcarpus]KIK21828.1 hypothetical protein PISMIDRAFT_680952 [Pisolithus microcarpus 441]
MTGFTGASCQMTVARVATAHWHPCQSFCRQPLPSGRLGALPQGMANVIDIEAVRIHLGRRVTSICQNQDLIITAASDFPSRADQP